MSPQSYQQQLRALLPRGRLWRAPDGSWFANLLLAIGDGFARLHARADALKRELNPSTTTEMLPEWESTFGLPDNCIPGGGSTEQRRNAVCARFASTGGANKDYFIRLAASYGYTVTVEDLDTDYWRVNAAEPTVLVNSTCNGTCDDPLESFGNEQLECLVNRLAHSHTEVVFAYGS